MVEIQGSSTRSVDFGTGLSVVSTSELAGAVFRLELRSVLRNLRPPQPEIAAISPEISDIWVEIWVVGLGFRAIF